MTDKDLKELRAWLKENAIRKRVGSDRGLIKLIKKDGTEILFENNICGDGGLMIYILEEWKYKDCPLFQNDEIRKSYINTFIFKGKDWGLARYDCDTKSDKRAYVFKDKDAEYYVYACYKDPFTPIIIVKW